MHHTWRSILFSSPAIFVLVAGITSASVPAEEVITIGGTGTSIGVLKLISAKFQRENPGFSVAVLPSMGSSGGIKAVAKGALDIGIAGRPLNPDEKSPALSDFEFARTPFALVTGKDAGVSELAVEDLVKIYLGETKTWPSGVHIRLILRPASDIDTDIARSISPAMSAAMGAALAREGMLTAMTDQENADMLEKIPGSFGFCTLTQVIAERRNLNVLSFNGEAPSVKTLKSGSYPLVKSLYLITKTGAPPRVRRFIDFMRSTEGARILLESGAMPVISRRLE